VLTYPELQLPKYVWMWGSSKVLVGKWIRVAKPLADFRANNWGFWAGPTLLLRTHVTVFTTRRVLGKSVEPVYNVNVGFRRLALVV
jgi:hypothetical protein